VTYWRNVIAVAVGLPALVAGADPDMMSLVMPDASMVMEVNVAKIMASPIGSAMGEAFHQGITTQLKTELTKAKPQFQEQIAGLSNIDWSRDVQDIVIAGGPGKQPAALMIVRSSLDLARIQSLKGFTGDSAEYEGVTMLVSSKPGNGVIAFVDNSIVVIGQVNDVKAAIHRRSQHAAFPAALSARLAKYSGNDIWVVTVGPLTMPASNSAVGSPAAAKEAEKYLEQVAGFNCGLRFSPDLEFSADVETRTDKAAADMAEGLRWLTGMVKSQMKQAGKSGTGLEDLQYQVNGRRILLSLHVPEEQIRARIRQMRVAQASQLAAAPRAVEAPRAAPSSGLSPPPPGTIRVQSSEGTVLIPVEKAQ